MIGETIAQYRILELLGSGGMGVVYKAIDDRLGRQVALKFLTPGVTGDPEANARFMREARSASSIDHPNICTIYEIGETDDNRLYLAMAFYEGETLRQKLVRGGLPEQDALRIAIAIGEGLSRAHKAGIVHRDIKPANVILTREGEVKILDFGLAKLVGEVGHTREGTFVGTPQYMSPEQISGSAIDHRTDIWSLGVVLYEMLEGVAPFRAENDRVLFEAIRNGETPPAIDPIRRALEKGPAQRFATMDEMVAALRAAATVDSQEATVRKETAPTPPSIAVLPFVDMSSGKDQEYLCDGLAEEVINMLTKIEGLRVTSRTSSFAFKGTTDDVRAIGKRLNVTSILEGSVRKAGARLRVTVQVIDVGSGYHLWSERYDREIEDIFAIQDDIAEQTVRALRLILDNEAPKVARTTDLRAYEHYLRGRQLLQELGFRNVTLARESFRRATEMDPSYMPAWAGLSESSGWLYTWHGGAQEYLSEAETASMRALELAPDTDEAHVARGHTLSIASKYPEADVHFLRAIELVPNSYNAHYLYGRSLFSQGRLEESGQEFETAAEVNPEDFQALSLSTMAWKKLGQADKVREVSEEALRRIDRRLAIHPTDLRALYFKANALFHLGQPEEATVYADRILAAEPDDTGVLYNITCFYALTKNRKRALECLERVVGTQGARSMGDWMANDPDLESIRDLPEFAAILKRLR